MVLATMKQGEHPSILFSLRMLMSALMAQVPILLNDTADLSTLTLYLHIRADFSLFQSVLHKVNLCNPTLMDGSRGAQPRQTEARKSGCI